MIRNKLLRLNIHSVASIFLAFLGEEAKFMKKITNQSLFDLKSTTQPIVVGNTAFYVQTEIREEDNQYFSSIYRIDLETKTRTLFGDSGSVNTQIKVSGDKKSLTYLSNHTENEKMQLFSIPLDGGAAKQLTFEENGISNYHWLENSKTIYYQTNIKKEEEEKEEDKKDLPTKRVFTKLNYKADGSGPLPEDRLYQIKKITTEEPETKPQLIVEENRSLTLLYVAKDESYLLYFDRFDPEDEWVYGGSIFKYDVESKQATLITEQIPGGIFGEVLPSENEEYFLFTGNDFGYKFVTNNHVYGYEVQRKSLTNLTPDLDYGVGDSLSNDFQQNIAGPDMWWLEDGKTFLFKATEQGKIVLYRGFVEGGYEKVFDQNMQITGLDLLEDKSRAVITYSTLTIPSRIALLDLETEEITDLYDPNEQFFQEHQVSEPERFWFKSVQNWDIQGWYVPPIETRQKHPAILYIHGGPQVSYGETFFHEMQALAGAGYGVILLNPRGGSGYGQEFVASILNNYGDEDYQDLLNGTDYVLENYPKIDPDRVYVAGGSYGGFMTNWMVTHTNRFKAAVTQRSISNWISFYGTSDVGPSFVEFQLGRDLSDVEDLWKMSPLAHAKNAQTPLLILHGEEDHRCPQEQGEQMYRAMKKQRVQTRLVTFPQSSHGLSREGLPNLRIERLEEIVDWFETHK